MEHPQQTRIHIIRGLLVTAITIAISVLLSIVIMAQAWSNRPGEDVKARITAQSTISVKGKSTQRITSDRGVWDSTVFADGPTLKDAYQKLESDMLAVRAFLGVQTFTDGELLVSAIGTQVRYERNDKNKSTDVIKGYTLSQTVTVTSDRLQLLAHAASQVTDLIGEGIRIVSTPPQFVATTLPDVKAKIIGAATADARRRAELMVQSSGGRLGEVRQIRQGVIQVVRPDSTAMTSYGIYDTSTVEKDASVVVTVEFSVTGS